MTLVIESNASYEQQSNSYVNDPGRSPYMKEILDNISAKSFKKHKLKYYKPSFGSKDSLIVSSFIVIYQDKNNDSKINTIPINHSVVDRDLQLVSHTTMSYAK
jgi:hypothetical protein